ncbi:MAG: fibrobacter succinogenes major paralogous domain-containing protein [Saprospiraceae bacterium]|nr:fibrobacter succinogenes major paralogous domain-containing protein [Saprospiraceae bacterium]
MITRLYNLRKIWYSKGLYLSICFFVCVFFASGQKIITNGSIQIGKDTVGIPEAGTIRWTGSDFEGWSGSRWLSLTVGDKIVDGDGNVYYAIKIGNQVWLDRNLKVTKYSDGTSIPLSSNATQWNTAAVNLQPSYCWYNDDELSNAVPYGALYNFYALDSLSNGGKNVCPDGWLVPTKSDLEVLRDNLGGQKYCRRKIEGSWVFVLGFS